MIGLDWRNLFEEVILERAIGICLEHKVQNIQTEPFHIRADVFGTEKYHVEIKYGDMFSMTCTCPYARKEKNCKHMAAVCLIAKTKLSIDINALTNRDHDIIHTFLNHINEQEAKALIQRLMDKYPYIARKIYQEEIKAYYHKKDTKRYLDILKKQIKEFEEGCILYEQFEKRYATSIDMFSNHYDGYALYFVEFLFESLKLIKIYIHGNCFFLKYYLKKWKMILNHHPELNKEIYKQVMYTLEETEADKVYLGVFIFESFEDDLYYEKLEIAKRYKEEYEIYSRYYHQLHYKS